MTRDTKKLLDLWGSCVYYMIMNKHEEHFVEFWSLVIEELGGSPSENDMLELTHETQVALFSWCSCEDNEGNENPYDDCPPHGEPRYI